MKRFKLGDMIEHCFLPDSTFLVVGFDDDYFYRILSIRGVDEGDYAYLSIWAGDVHYNKVGNIFEKRGGGK